MSFSAGQSREIGSSSSQDSQGSQVAAALNNDPNEPMNDGDDTANGNDDSTNDPDDSNNETEDSKGDDEPSDDGNGKKYKLYNMKHKKLKVTRGHSIIALK